MSGSVKYLILASSFTVLAVSNLVFGETLTLGQWLWAPVLVLGCAFAVLSQKSLATPSGE